MKFRTWLAVVLLAFSPLAFSASGDALLVWTALSNEPPDADYATLDAILTASADEPDDVILVLEFDPGATNEFAAFSAVMPEHYGGGGVTLTIMWASDGATTGNVKWDAAFKSFTVDVDNLNTKVYAAIQTATEATASASGELQYTDVNFTDGGQMDSVAKNEYFRLTLERDSADAGDTMNSNDAQVVAVYLTEQ